MMAWLSPLTGKPWRPMIMEECLEITALTIGAVSFPDSSIKTEPILFSSAFPPDQIDI
jgi:hypothetical protein